jgi:bifunctional UDP-N-acetylglucosamine pyrophosphorylase/glucosamine-1-phosphate N-acetyltransferase
MNLQIIILAAGKGTRMNSALPKVLVGLAGKPLIQHLLDHIKPLETSAPPIIVVGFKYELVQSYLGPGYIYAFQEGQFGTAHAAAAGLEKVEAENTLILYGDMPFVTAASIQKLVDLHAQSNSVFSMLTTTVPNFENEYASLMGFGRIIRDESGNILRNTELVDASESEKLIKEVNPSFYLFNTTWLKNNINLVKKNIHGEYYLTDLLELAVKTNVPIVTLPIDPKEALGVNTPEQLAQAAKML